MLFDRENFKVIIMYTSWKDANGREKKIKKLRDALTHELPGEKSDYTMFVN